MIPVLTIEPLCEAVTRVGFAFVPAATMQGILPSFGLLADWQAFAESWGDLRVDTYMADGGRYRQRRHAAYSVTRDGAIARKPHQAHFQTRDYNPLNGGIARWFEPIDTAVGEGPTLQTILRFCHSLFQAVAPASDGWDVEAHQFRIEARRETHGRPTPEGMHRDGVDFALVLLIDRCNIARGTTTIQASDGRPLGSFTLTETLDAVVVDDRRVYHGVTPVEPLDPSRSAHRDVLVVTFRQEGR